MSSCFVLGSKPNFEQIKVKNYYWKTIKMEMQKKNLSVTFYSTFRWKHILRTGFSPGRSFENWRSYNARYNEQIALSFNYNVDAIMSKLDKFECFMGFMLWRVKTHFISFLEVNLSIILERIRKPQYISINFQ